MAVGKKYVALLMRAILRNQCTFSYMPREIVKYIFDENLLVKREWPAWLISLTPKGSKYLQAKGDYYD